MKRTLSLIVVPHDNATTRTYKVSYRTLFVLAAVLAAAVAVMFVVLVSYGFVARKASHVAGLERENRALSARVAQVDSLEHELIQLQTMSIQIKRMLGVGLSRSDSLLVTQLSGVVRSPAITDDGSVNDAGRTAQQQALKSVPSLWPVRGYVTRAFFTTGGEKSADYHPGIDIAAKKNTPVIASAEGTVITSGWDETYGNMVVIDHGFGIYTLYGHNSRNLVKVGDRVARGQTIAFVGSSGKSSAPHLHFEVRRHGLPVDPRDYLLD